MMKDTNRNYFLKNEPFEEDEGGRKSNESTKVYSFKITYRWIKLSDFRRSELTVENSGKVTKRKYKTINNQQINK